MNLAVKNLDKPSDKKWKKIADYLLFIMLPAMNTFFVAIQPVSPEFTIWAIAGSNLLIALFKGMTKFTAETESQVDAG
jgi:hypothetical protein